MSSITTQTRLWALQRLSAMALSLFVAIHLVGIIMAVRGGLSAAEILARTRGNWAVALFYGAFVLACAVHVPIGLARVAEEWLGWRAWPANAAAAVAALLLAILGLRAVYAVVA
ncbi:MAG: succinate dehydrogenase [Proteobacteria bacterium]|jgi:fumarate reductase subunit C|nr:succinate dehydrogenase [Pseudomonadota bacterium]